MYLLMLPTLHETRARTYSRFAAQPALRMPFHVEGFNLLASSSLIERLYSINQKPLPDAPITANQKGSANFQTVMIEGDVNFQAFRNYQTNLFGIGEMQSVIKPRVTYTFIPNTNTATTSLPSTDPSDQIARTNTVTYSFNHYLNATSKDSAREISLLEIDQTYGLSGNLLPRKADAGLVANVSYLLLGGGSYYYAGTGSRFSDIHVKLTAYPSRTLFAGRRNLHRSLWRKGLDH